MGVEQERDAVDDRADEQADGQDPQSEWTPRLLFGKVGRIQRTPLT
jgi:hypothetical protein